MPRTIWLDDERLFTWDQTRLPFEAIVIELAGAADCAHAISSMQVRGAPLIGAVGAYGLAFALREDDSDAGLSAARDTLLATRPTAVNLRWALDRVAVAVAGWPRAERAARAWREAAAICDEDVACNLSIGRHAAALLAPLRRGAEPLRILTHCNAGRIATVDHGTALAAVYALADAGVPVHVWVDETRPRNQGAGLTAWELRERSIAHTVIVDNAGGLLMRQGLVDAVIVGCDRVAANGDVANKVGTYLKALAARDNGLPFYVACPVSTIDAGCRGGDAIAIEQRSPREVTHVAGRAPDGSLVEVQITPDGSSALNPAFDITPARLVTALITEHGVVAASADAIRGLRPAGASARGSGEPSRERQGDVR
jgi:methylthioribose-1-phosphate isomerase